MRALIALVMIAAVIGCYTSSADKRHAREREITRTVAEYMGTAAGESAVVEVVEENAVRIFADEMKEEGALGGLVLLLGGWGYGQRLQRKNGKGGK